MNTPYAAAARISPLSPDAMEQWADVRQVSPTEALRLWTHAHGDATVAHAQWQDSTQWSDDVCRHLTTGTP